MRSLAAKGEADEENDNAVVGTVMTGCRAIIEAIVNNNLEAQGNLDARQQQWVSEFALALLEGIDPRFKNMAVTVMEVPEGESVVEALQDFAREYGSRPRETN